MVPGPGLERAMTTSTPSIASAMPPLRPSPLVIWHSCHLSTYSALRISRSLRSRPEDAPAVDHIALGRINAPTKDQARASHIGSPGLQQKRCLYPLFLSNNLEGIDQAGQRDRCSTLLHHHARPEFRLSLAAYPRIRKHFGWEISSRFTPPKPGCSMQNGLDDLIRDLWCPA